jgi:hypothetical protein
VTARAIDEQRTIVLVAGGGAASEVAGDQTCCRILQSHGD